VQIRSPVSSRGTCFTSPFRTSIGSRPRDTFNPKESSITQKPGRGVLAAAKAAKEVTDMKLVNVFAKNGFDEVWTYLQPFGARELAHIRVTEDQNGEMVPTKKGMAVDTADLPKLVKAVRALVLDAAEWRGA
jgi:hypothetical protein